MSAKPKPCTLGPKHKWTWLKNAKITMFTFGGRASAGQLSLKGIYKCECGEKKTGQPNWEDKNVQI